MSTVDLMLNVCFLFEWAPPPLQPSNFWLLFIYFFLNILFYFIFFFYFFFFWGGGCFFPHLFLVALSIYVVIKVEIK